MTEEMQSTENFRRTSLKEKYMSLLEEKKDELNKRKNSISIIRK
jgi:hypothetical protein